MECLCKIKKIYIKLEIFLYKRVVMGIEVKMKKINL